MARCKEMGSSHSGPIHSHIQFPALSIHQWAHFVSADFILAAAITSEQGPTATGELFHLPSASPQSADGGPLTVKTEQKGGGGGQEGTDGEDIVSQVSRNNRATEMRWMLQ
ncbi:hypothetical protein EYF80_007271 [Liparis tanakae]|uniref:Uncharacterized protein n=1 Tax=Liparis tanakae TaxID=230148 RepID=A0A4Z2IX32_9TELE|nr:hypothetical protein EYF80_007271 [Liparis tanakae]